MYDDYYIDYKKVMSEMKDFCVQIGLRLRDLRHDRGLTIDTVAEKGGISPTTVLRVEHGGRDARISTLCIICAALDVTLGDLLWGVTNDGSEYPDQFFRSREKKKG